jgi:ankyrin repeat protein
MKRTPLHRAAFDGRTRSVKKLLAKGVEVNCKDINGKTPLHLAALKGNEKIVSLLIAHGADVNSKETLKGNSPLHYAAFGGHPKTVKILLSSGANANIRDVGGMTPLDTVMALLQNISKFHPIRLVMGRRLEACRDILREHEAK